MSNMNETIQIVLTSEQVSRKSIAYWMSEILPTHSYDYHMEVRPNDVLVTVVLKRAFYYNQLVEEIRR